MLSVCAACAGRVGRSRAAVAAVLPVSPSVPVAVPAAFSRSRTLGTWSGVPLHPPDPILGLTEAFVKDSFPSKVNLGVGAYRDAEGNPWVLPSVHKAAKINFDNMLEQRLEYLPISGLPSFVDASLRFAYGDECDALKDKRVAAVQSLSGTGALRVGFEFLRKYHDQHVVLLPNKTWGNHTAIVKNASLDVKPYSYVGEDGVSLDFDAMLADVRAAPAGAAILLHACAHNPTGIDPTREQWDELSLAIKDQGLLPFFDMAYQGFASGDAEVDAYSVRKFLKDGHKSVMLAQSYAKNFGLYGERVGCLSITGESRDEADQVQSQLKAIIRPMYSSPPAFGARLVSTVLNDGDLKAQWYRECKSMADRIGTMRGLLTDALVDLGSTRDWSHLTSQIGMFAFTGLSTAQCKELIDTHHIYLTQDGRFSMAGINGDNVEYVANAVHEVTK